MKAKVKETGKVIDVTLNRCSVPVQGCGATSVYKGDDGKTYFDTELDFIHVYPDWQQVRIQASIAAMQGIIANPHRDGIIEDLAKLSVEFAEALIKELKKTM